MKGQKKANGIVPGGKLATAGVRRAPQHFIAAEELTKAAADTLTKIRARAERRPRAAPVHPGPQDTPEAKAILKHLRQNRYCRMVGGEWPNET